jgi:hypothetical protein
MLGKDDEEPRFGTEGSEVQILSPRPIPKKSAKFRPLDHSVPTEGSAVQIVAATNDLSEKH